MEVLGPPSRRALQWMSSRQRSAAGSMYSVSYTHEKCSARHRPILLQILSMEI